MRHLNMTLPAEEGHINLAMVKLSNARALLREAARVLTGQKRRTLARGLLGILVHLEQEARRLEAIKTRLGGSRTCGARSMPRRHS